MTAIVEFPVGWYHETEPKAKDGHKHLYAFRTLQCSYCSARPAVYQYVDGPNFHVIPPAPVDRAFVTLERVDVWVKEMNKRLAAGHHQLYTHAMLGQYPPTLYDELVCADEQIPPGWEHLYG